MEPEKIFTTGKEINASDLGATETWVFPKVVHLRLVDHSLLKFAPGARQVPTSLIEAEKEWLRRNGASKVEAQPKQASNETESASGEAQGAEGSQGQADSTDGSKEESTSDKKVSKKK